MNQIYSNVIEINDDAVLNTLFADDQALLLDSDDDTQRVLYTRPITKTQIGLEMSSLKSKLM
jgi:hypothetical protein